MAAEELRDLRVKISVQTDAVLHAHSRATGQKRSEIVREILHKWSLEQIAIYNLLDKRLDAEGLAGNVGNVGESLKVIGHR